MDRNLIIKLLQQCTTDSENEAREIIALKAQYPYCQVLQVLLARVSKDLQLSIQQEQLQAAAVYSSDRAILKDIMTREYVEETEETPPANFSDPGEKQSISETINAIDLADTLLSDLQELRKLKNNFEILFSDETKVSLPVKEELAASNLPVKEDIVTSNLHTKAEIIDNSQQLNDAPKSKETSKSRKKRIIELAKAVNVPSDKIDDTDLSQQILTRRKRKENSTHELIDEIKDSKNELKPESDKQKEQIVIIDQFIKVQPSITSARERTPPVMSDLNPIKSGEFGENIVSETLVEILIKQGKKDKAIEVLKKLIWKYPQKKAYFASQIEDLKK